MLSPYSLVYLQGYVMRTERKRERTIYFQKAKIGRKISLQAPLKKNTMAHENAVFHAIMHLFTTKRLCLQESILHKVTFYQCCYCNFTGVVLCHLAYGSRLDLAHRIPAGYFTLGKLGLLSCTILPVLSSSSSKSCPLK